MTQKYVKFIDENKVKLAPPNYKLEDGSYISNFNKDPEVMLIYSFKLLVEVERPETQRYYKITYIETESTVEEVLTYLETEEEYQQRLYNERKANFENKFLETSLGNYRLKPKGYSNAQQSIDVVNEQVKRKGSLTEELATMVLFYETPDFSKEEECTEEWLIEHQYSIDPMTKEAWDTYYDEFTTLYAQKMYQQLLLGLD